MPEATNLRLVHIRTSVIRASNFLYTSLTSHNKIISIPCATGEEAEELGRARRETVGKSTNRFRKSISTRKILTGHDLPQSYIHKHIHRQHGAQGPLLERLWSVVSTALVDVQLTDNRRCNQTCTTRYRNETIFPEKRALGIPVLCNSGRFIWLLVKGRGGQTIEDVTTEKRACD